MLDFLFPADQDAEDISWSDENIRVGVTWAAWQFALKSGVTLWCGSCRGFEVGVIHDQYGESLQVRVRLSETVLIAGFGSVDAALEALPCRMWLRTAADEKSTMQKTVTAALRQAEGELSPEAAALGLSRFWSETDDTGLMAQGTPFEIEALLMTETALLAAQLQALHDMRCTQLAGKMDPSVWLV